MINKRRKNPERIREVMVSLQSEKILDTKYKDHKLTGNWSGRRECHIEPDLLLIYKLTETHIIFERTGTHADLFE